MLAREMTGDSCSSTYFLTGQRCHTVFVMLVYQRGIESSVTRLKGEERGVGTSRLAEYYNNAVREGGRGVVQVNFKYV